jgi:hypothetical protein
MLSFSDSRELKGKEAESDDARQIFKNLNRWTCSYDDIRLLKPILFLKVKMLLSYFSPFL